jgi:galactokinase
VSGRVPDLTREFSERLGTPPRLFSAPGRVNLIGEHTDYNDGFVLPMGINRRLYVAGRARADRLISVGSLNLEGDFSFDLTRPYEGRRNGWVDYVEGIARTLFARGAELVGADLLLWSDVPFGAGLSSSAALEVGVGYALLRLAGLTAPSGTELALAAQAAEHEYVGVLCGIMDQYAATLAQPDSALLIDCRSLQARPVPLALGAACILICDTRVKHELAASAYNVRRSECREGAAQLALMLPSVTSLRDVTWDQFVRYEAALPSLVRQRCRHVIRENERTLRAASAFEGGRLGEAGELMSASHASLRDDYAVSCPELDEAVAVACAQPGVYGSRMTGGGFGGCTVTLLERAAVASVSSAIKERFRERFASEPSFFVSEACGGVREDRPASEGVDAGNERRDAAARG